MSAPSGPKSRAPFAHYDPDTSSWRTLQPSLLPENFPEQSPIWPRSGMWDSGAAYELPTLVPPTAEPGSSSLLPTPDTGESLTGHGRRGGRVTNGHQSGQSLEVVATLLPMPTSSDTNGAGTHGTGGADLRTTVELLPTPTAMDAHGSGGNSPSDVTLTDAVVRTQLGASTNPRLDGGNASSDD